MTEMKDESADEPNDEDVHGRLGSSAITQAQHGERGDFAVGIPKSKESNNNDDESEDDTQEFPGFVGRQDYRLDFTEVEGILESVPEEGVGASIMHASNEGTVEVDRSVVLVGKDVELSQGKTNEQSAPVHESDEKACSHNHQHCNSFVCPLEKTSCAQPLTARQQVALWLTKTSVNDMSSMTSLKSLIFPSSNLSFRSSSKRSAKKKRKNRKAEVHRNFSTKSLINGYGMPKLSNQNRFVIEIDDEDDGEGSPIMMRKCETMMTLSGHGIEGQQPQRSESKMGNFNECRTPSSLSLFKKLTRRRGSSRMYPHRNQSQSKMHSRLPSFSNASDCNGGGSRCDSPFRGLQPMNRLRSKSSLRCSNCASMLSMSQSQLTSRNPSQLSMAVSGIRRISTSNTIPPHMENATSDPGEFQCKICLEEIPAKDFFCLQTCQCSFCQQCLNQYLSMEIIEGAYDIACPDPDCSKEGVFGLDEIEQLVTKDLFEKHKTYRLNTEVALDKNRAWCPTANCETICHVCDTDSSGKGVAVQCPTCSKEFCSQCLSNWHPGKTCQENGRNLVSSANNALSGIFGNGNMSAGNDFIFEKFNGKIKPCPLCQIPIERNAGCAQMMCKRCKHVFCWFCLESLDDDFLLRHYDSGPCKGQLGHSRASVLWHRAQVIGIFAGFGLLIVLASPLLLLGAPCILCCRCNKLMERFDTESNEKEPTSYDENGSPEEAV